MNSEPSAPSDSSVQSTIDRPTSQPSSGVPAPYGSGPDYGSPYGMMTRGGPSSGIYGSVNAAPDPVKVLDPLSLLLALRKRWFVALTLGLLTGAMAAAAVWNLWPPVTGGAQVQLMVKASSPYVFIQEAAGDFNVFKRTQAMVVKSRKTLETAIKLPEVADLPMMKKMSDPIRVLEQNVAADYAMAPEMMTLTLPANPEDVKDAVVIVDAIASTYLAERTKTSNNSKRLEILEGLYMPVAEQIKGNRNLLHALSRGVDRKDIHLREQRHRMLLKEVEMAEKRFLEMKDKRESQDFELTDLREQFKVLKDLPITPEEIDAIVKSDPTYKALAEKVRKEESDIEFASKQLKGNKANSTFTKLQAEVIKLKKQLDTLYKEMYASAEAQLKENRYGNIQKLVFELQNSVRVMKRMEEQLGVTIASLHNRSMFAAATSEEADVLKAQIDVDMEMASQLTGEMDKLKLELKAPDRVTKFSDAYTYEPTTSRKQVMSTYVAGLGAFGLVIFGISWWEFRGRRINSVDEVVNNLGLRVVGALPALPDRRGRYAPSRDNFYPNYLIESVDTTRTMLLHAARRESLRTVMVTSANSGEGKTSLSIQLAASLARAGRKTLLIDGDMRNPAAHQVFNLPREPGFSELLRGEVEIPATVLPTSVRNLWLIPAGRWSPHTTEALSQEAVLPILERLKGEFDFIIVDTSPVLAAVDSLLVAQQVDAIIFSILHEVSHSPSVYAAHQRLESLGVRILGAVINGVASSQLGHKTDYVYEDESPPAEMEPEEEEV